MGEFSKCPNRDCGNKTDRDYVYKCKNCGKMVCSECKGTRCPKCDKTDGTFSDYCKEVGRIIRD